MSPQSFEHLTNEKPKFSEMTDKLLADQEILKLPPEEQGRVILDRFIGGVVRQGETTGTGAKYAAADVFQLMDAVSAEGAPALQAITRTEGLRDSVAKLAQDERTAILFGSISSRVKSEKGGTGDGELTLTSAAQIEGYLLQNETPTSYKPVGVGMGMPGETWVPVIMDRVQNMADSTYATWMTDAQARDLTTSSSDYIRHSGNDWRMAKTSATEAGVDMELVKRSAEELQRRVTGQHDLGATAMFIATRGQIKEYKTSLDRRGGILKNDPHTKK